MMRRHLTHTFAGWPIEERFDRVIEILLLSLLAFSPLALGVVHAWSKEIVIAGAGLITLVFLLKLVVCRDVPFARSWVYLPISAFVVVAIFQLMPLPVSMVETLSPNTVSLKSELLGDLPNADEMLSSMTLSFYPLGTKHDLRLVLAVAAIFVVVFNVYRQPERIKRLLAGIAVIGGTVALLAVAQHVAGNGKIFWRIPTYDGAGSGPFVNHSHYGQFMNLSMGVAFGLLLVTLHEAFSCVPITPGSVAEYLTAGSGRRVRILLAIIVLGVATVFLSLTRGGVLSMLMAGAFTALMFSWRQSVQGRGWILVFLALGAFVCILYVGFDQVYDRLATLRDLQDAQSGRWQIVKDIALAWTRFPLFGVGLGTHEVVYPMFDRSTIAALAMHAENEYAQAAEETGAAGLTALIAIGAIIWACYLRAVRRSLTSIHLAAYGLGLGLLAILIHSLSDFGQHLPANAMLTAVCGALLVALPSVGREGEQPRKFSLKSQRAVRSWRVTALLLVAGVWIWCLQGAERARAAEVHWAKVREAERHLEAANWVVTPLAQEYLFAHALAATDAEPDNIRYRYWLGAYKWLSLTPCMDPNTGRLESEALPWAVQIVQELHQARPLCPTFGALYCLAGEIEQFSLGDPRGAEHIDLGYRLAPCDATACLAAGRIDFTEDRVEEAFAKIERAVCLDPSSFERAVDLFVSDFDRPDLALRLASDNVARLAHLSDMLGSMTLSKSTSVAGSHPTSADPTHARIKGLLEVRCAERDAPASSLASLAKLYYEEGQLELAIQHYQRALRSDYDQIGWHYGLAKALAEVDQVEQAMHEARICLRFRADYAPARRLIQDLSVSRLLRESRTAVAH